MVISGRHTHTNTHTRTHTHARTHHHPHQSPADRDMWLDAFRERATSRAPEMEGFLNYKKKIKDSKFKRSGSWWSTTSCSHTRTHPRPTTS